jgi:hypothetical protein
MNGQLASKLPGGRCEGRSRKAKVEDWKALRCNPLHLGSIGLNLLAVPILQRQPQGNVPTRSTNQRLGITPSGSWKDRFSVAGCGRPRAGGLSPSSSVELLHFPISSIHRGFFGGLHRHVCLETGIPRGRGEMCDCTGSSPISGNNFLCVYFSRGIQRLDA